MRKLDEQCAICGGQLIEKKVEKLLKGRKQHGFLQTQRRGLFTLW